jgi:hypothetical protein
VVGSRQCMILARMSEHGVTIQMTRDYWFQSCMCHGDYLLQASSRSAVRPHLWRVVCRHPHVAIDPCIPSIAHRPLRKTWLLGSIPLVMQELAHRNQKARSWWSIKRHSSFQRSWDCPAPSTVYGMRIFGIPLFRNNNYHTFQRPKSGIRGGSTCCREATSPRVACACSSSMANHSWLIALLRMHDLLIIP